MGLFLLAAVLATPGPGPNPNDLHIHLHGLGMNEFGENPVKNKEAGEDYSQVPMDEWKDQTSGCSKNPKNCKFTSWGRWQKDGPCGGKSRERKCLCADGKKGNPHHDCGNAMDCQCKRTKKRCPIISGISC